MASSSFSARVLREPLLHFIVLGAVLFGIDHVTASRIDDPHLIVVGADVDGQIKTLFRDSKGREATDADMKSLRERWVDNEVLYREGLSLRVDQGDPTIRERVIFKALTVIEASLQAPTIDEKGLRAWFETNKGKYGDPARLDFLEAVIGGDATDEAVASFVAALNSGAQGEATGGLRVYKGRPRDNIVTSFGADFTSALEKLPVGAWHSVPSSAGVRVVRLDAVKAADEVDFAKVRGEVLQDWKDAQMVDLRTRAVRDLAKKYTVQVAGADK
jgi:hypothetical protein